MALMTGAVSNAEAHAIAATPTGERTPQQQAKLDLWSSIEPDYSE